MKTKLSLLSLLSLLLTLIISSCSKDKDIDKRSNSRLLYTERSLSLYARDLESNYRTLIFDASDGQKILDFKWLNKVKKIALLVSSRTYPYELYLLNPDGSGLQKLADTRFNSIVLSPDGTRLAYIDDYPQNIYTTLTDGSDKKS